MRAVLLLMLALAACGSPPVAKPAADITAIETQMRARFDRPDARLDAGPVVVSGDHAVADWTQGAMGGRALFERRDGKWWIVLCSGDALRDPAYLRQARVPEVVANVLARDLANAERTVPAERLARMRSFTGTVTADQMPK